MKKLSTEEALKWFNSDDRGLYFSAYEVMRLFGPEVLKSLRAGELTAYFDNEDNEPLIPKDDLMVWMSEDKERFARMVEWKNRN